MTTVFKEGPTIHIFTLINVYFLIQEGYMLGTLFYFLDSFEKYLQLYLNFISFN